MKFLQKASLQRKQMLIVMLTTGIALLLTCVTFAAYDNLTLHRAIVRNLSTLAKIVADNSTAALDFNDQESATEILAALKAEPNIEGGCIYTQTGKVFAFYTRPDRQKQIFPKMLPGDGEYFSDGTLHLFRQITLKGDHIGTVYVASDLDELYSRLRRYLFIAATVFLVASLISLMLSAHLQKLISDPILHLVKMSRRIAQEKNYSLRAVKQDENELGTLVDNFNEMLSEIQVRDGELQYAKDVLELRVLERTQSLRASEERFSNAFEHAAVGMALVAIDGSSLKVNKTLCDLLGYSTEELMLKSFQELTHPEDLEQDLCQLQRLLAGEIRYYNMEKRYLHRDGHIIWGLLGVSLIRDARGQPIHFISQVQDITERKRADELLRRTEELYRRAIGGAGAVPYSYDYTTKSYVFMGAEIEQLIGYTPAEMTGELWKKILQETVMVGEAAGLDKTEAARRILAGDGRNWRCDMRVLTKSGKSRWISDAAIQTLDETGRPTGSMGILQDITERKEAEQTLRERDEKFHQLANNITDVFWIRSPDMKEVHYVSPAFERIWGLPANKHYSNPEKWVDAILPEDRERVTAAFSSLTQTTPSIDVEYRIKRPDGSIRWIQSRGFQVRDKDGTLVRLTGIVTDITERKQTALLTIAFSKLAQNLSSSASPEEAANIISDISDDLLGWDAFSIQLYSEKEDSIYSIFEADTVDGRRIRTGPLHPRKPTDLHRRIFSQGAELIQRDSAESIIPGTIPFGSTAKTSASIMYAPIRSGSKAVGIISVHSYTPNAYDAKHLETLQVLANQCSGALDRLRADEELRKSESQFRLVWNTSADGMRLTNQRGIVLMVNDAYCQMVGKERSELEGHLLSVIHNEESGRRVLRRNQEQFHRNAARLHLEKEVTLWDGRKMWFELSNSLLKVSGETSLLLTIFRDITQRKKAEADLSAMHTQLLDTSRKAGMAEVATSVLHNVGNVLNSVNVSSSLIREKINKSRVPNLSKAVSIFQEHANDLPGFFANDPRGQHLPNYLLQLSDYLSCEQQEVLREVTSLVSNVEHIKEIVTMQQTYAKVSGISALCHITDLVEDALRMNAGALERENVRIIREFSHTEPVTVEKHKVLQILVNLIRNAEHALEENDIDEKEIRLRVELTEQKSVRISVIDNGVGIPVENLTRIFAHGFTTRSNGHGFGLHSGALAAQEMGGALIAHSEGLGKGAVFTLELPC